MSLIGARATNSDHRGTTWFSQREGAKVRQLGSLLQERYTTQEVGCWHRNYDATCNGTRGKLLERNACLE
eukprot:2295542-Amphidinium_carterae.1